MPPGAGVIPMNPDTEFSKSLIRPVWQGAYTIGCHKRGTLWHRAGSGGFFTPRRCLQRSDTLPLFLHSWGLQPSHSPIPTCRRCLQCRHSASFPPCSGFTTFPIFNPQDRLPWAYVPLVHSWQAVVAKHSLPPAALSSPILSPNNPSPKITQ